LKRVLHIVFIISCFLAIFYLIIGKDIFIREFLAYAYGVHLLVGVLLVLTALVLVFGHSRPRSTHPCIPLIILLLWTAYLLLYRLTGPDSESYYWSYLLVSFAAFYLVYLLLRLQAVSASVALEKVDTKG
jgi:hypothetical protein